MPKFRKKPVIIEAVQYDGTEASVVAILELAEPSFAVRAERIEGNGVIIRVSDFAIRVEMGQWVVLDEDQDLLPPCDPGTFSERYEPTEDPE